MNKSRKLASIFIYTSLIVAFGLFGFDSRQNIEECLVSYRGSHTLTAANPERTQESEDFRLLKTTKGDVKVSKIDSYKVNYLNDKRAAFVTLKVEMSDPKKFEKDKKTVLEHLFFLNAYTPGMETKNLMEFDCNGFKVYGISKNVIEGTALGTFVIFPGNHTTVYIYFNNLKSEQTNVFSVPDFKNQRDKFIKDYTAYINSCIKNKMKL